MGINNHITTLQSHKPGMGCGSVDLYGNYCRKDLESSGKTLKAVERSIWLNGIQLVITNKNIIQS